MSAVNFITAGQLRFSEGGGAALRREVDKAAQTVLTNFVPELSALVNNKLGALLGRDADAAPIIKDLLSDYHAQVIAPPDASRGATFSQSGVIGLFSMIDYLQPSAEEINDLAVSDSMKGHIHAAVASAKVAVPQALKELDLPQMDASTLKDYIPRFISTMMDQLHPPIQKT